MALALWTVAVAAAVITEVQLTAGRMVTAVDVAAQGRGAAFAQRVQGTFLPAAGTITGKMFPVSLQDMGYFMDRIRHHFWP